MYNIWNCYNLVVVSGFPKLLYCIFVLLLHVNVVEGMIVAHGAMCLEFGYWFGQNKCFYAFPIYWPVQNLISCFICALNVS